MSKRRTSKKKSMMSLTRFSSMLVTDSRQKLTTLLLFWSTWRRSSVLWEWAASKKILISTMMCLLKKIPWRWSFMAFRLYSKFKPVKDNKEGKFSKLWSEMDLSLKKKQDKCSLKSLNLRRMWHSTIIGSSGKLILKTLMRRKLLNSKSNIFRIFMGKVSRISTRSLFILCWSLSLS